MLWAPVAGPWLDLASRAKCIPAAAGSASATATFVAPCLGDTLTRVALVSAGAVQALAAILVAVGLPSSSQLVYGGDGTAENGHGPRLTILPSIGGTGRPGAGAPGLTAVGTF